MAIALMLAGGCARYWVPDAALSRLDAFDPAERAHVAVPAERLESRKPVHVRGVYVRPEPASSERPGWRRVRAYSRGLPTGVAMLSAGALLGYGVTHSDSTCAVCGISGVVGGAIPLGVGERNMQSLDGR